MLQLFPSYNIKPPELASLRAPERGLKYFNHGSTRGHARGGDAIGVTPWGRAIGGNAIIKNTMIEIQNADILHVQYIK